MASNLGNQVHHLVRERAYRTGDLNVTEREESEARERVRTANCALRKIKRRKDFILARIAEIDKKIQTLSALDPTLIRAIQNTPRLGQFQHGEFTSELVRVIREAGRPVPTGYLIKAMADAFGLPYDTPDHRIKAAKSGSQFHGRL